MGTSAFCLLTDYLCGLSRPQVSHLMCMYMTGPGLDSAQNPGFGRSLENIIHVDTLFVEAKIAIGNLPLTITKS